MNFNTTIFNKKQLKKYLEEKKTKHAHYITSAGVLKLFFIDAMIYQAQYIDETQIDKKFPFLSSNEITQLLIAGTPFQLKVWNALLQIPEGKTTNYFDIAHIIGHPQSWRAVANAVGLNPIAYLIPCHRVLRKAGDLCGYNWGIERKRRLLQSEKN